MPVIQRLKLHDGQRRILASPARYKVIAAGRRFGKTMLAGYWLTLRDEGSAIGGKRVAWLAPTYKILADAWGDIERTLRPVTRKVNKTEQRIELITGGKIDFWTLEDPDAGRSRRYHRVVIDEAAHARYLKEAWERAISPTLTDYRGDAWFISTPNGLNYFYELFQRGRDPSYPDWESFHMPSAANPHLRPEEIEQKQRELPELVFRQEYLAEFVTFGGGLVKPEMLVMGECPPGLRPVLGVDLAISERDGADYTAIVAMARDPDFGVIYIKEVERFRAGFHEVLTRIKAAAARHNPSIVAIEQTQFQAAVVQELARTTT
ncbi:MAG: terminase large subunit domain-containing protein, partial [Hylemonella sp.]